MLTESQKGVNAVQRYWENQKGTNTIDFVQQDPLLVFSETTLNSINALLADDTSDWGLWKCLSHVVPTMYMSVNQSSMLAESQKGVHAVQQYWENQKGTNTIDFQWNIFE